MRAEGFAVQRWGRQQGPSAALALPAASRGIAAGKGAAFSPSPREAFRGGYGSECAIFQVG